MKKIMWLLVAVLVLSSCHSREKIVYIQGAAEVGRFVPQASYEARVSKDDQLSVLVTCSDLELAVPFNLHRPQPSPANGGGYSTNLQNYDNLYYHVDGEGNILFPVLGKVHVEGMTRNEVSACLKQQIVDLGYIQDPIVNVTFANSHFSVLGEVNAPGTFALKNERLTVLEALAQAGDMTIFGERDKVRLVRKESDGERVISLNLKDPQLIAGPYYYIKNGDVLYVEPSGTRAANREVSSLSNYAISLTSIALTIASLIVTIAK